MSIDRDLSNLLKNFKKQKKKIESDVSKIILSDALEGVAEAKRRAPKAFGKLGQGIAWEKVGDFEYKVVSREAYSGWVEFGTGAKVKVPSEWRELANEIRGEKGGSFKDGLKRIEAWCRLKGIDEKYAYPILATILEKGQRPQPFMYPAFQKTKGLLKRDLERYVASYD